MKVAIPAPVAAPQKARTGKYEIILLTWKPASVGACLRIGPEMYCGIRVSQAKYKKIPMLVSMYIY